MSKNVMSVVLLSTAAGLAGADQGTRMDQSGITYNGNDGTFTGTDGTVTPKPTHETSLFEFPDKGQCASMASISAGMFLDPEKNYEVTTMSINNPSIPILGKSESFKHHTIEVTEVGEGKKAYVGYYPKATPESLEEYLKNHKDRPKLNDHGWFAMMSPMGVPGFITPDPIVESGLSIKGNTLAKIGETLTVSGKVFNEKLGESVNLGQRGRYSAPLGALTGAIEAITGPSTVSGWGASNCRTAAAGVMSDLSTGSVGGKKRRTRKRKRSTRRQKHKRSTRRRRQKHKRRTRKQRSRR